MISLDRVSFRYPGAQNPCLRGISLRIERGGFTALCGANGSGKTTLCKLLAGLIPGFIQGEMSGELRFCGHPHGLDLQKSARMVGMVCQDFENQIIRPAVLGDAAFSCENFGLENPTARAMKALESLGIGALAGREVRQLSGGETHLLALAGALAHEPELLIIDEPAAQLDWAHADGIYEILRALNAAGKTIVVCEHDPDYILKYCSSMLVLDGGRLVSSGHPRDVMRGELPEGVARPQAAQIALRCREAGGAQYDELPLTAEQAAAAFSPLEDTERPPLPVQQGGSVQLFRLENVSAGYGQTEVLREVNLRLNSGEKTVLLGANGSGKTTLLRLLCGAVEPQSGTILFDGNRARECSLVLQNPEQMFITDSIRNELEYSLRSRFPQDFSARAQELLERFSLTPFAERDGRLLSGGQARRAAIAIGASLCRPVLLLDEPTASLDLLATKEVLSALDALGQIAQSIIIATHDARLACEWAERVVLIESGAVAADGGREIAAQLRPPDCWRMAKALGMGDCFTADMFVSARRKVSR